MTDKELKENDTRDILKNKSSQVGPFWAKIKFESSNRSEFYITYTTSCLAPTLTTDIDVLSCNYQNRLKH